MASALSWWAEAGVDTIVAEEPRNWLIARPVPAPAPTPASVAELPSQPYRAMPAELDAFRAWLLAGDLPLASAAPRVGPAGDPASGLMVLVDMPSPEDVAAGSLLSGEAGALFDRMLAAIGRSRETIWLAPLSPTRTATGTLDSATTRKLAEIARHHVGLVGPRALLLFGDACAKALLGSAVAGARGRRHEIDTQAGKISTLVTIRPEKLLKQPALKRLAWDDLQLLMEDLPE